MAHRSFRVACVLVSAALAIGACAFNKKRTGTGTNVGSGLGSGDDLPPPGQPAARADDR